jgi:hypothetical protein
MSADTFIIVLDVALVIAALLAYLFRPRLGGQLGSGLSLIMIGIIILGLTHLTDTLIKDFVPAVDATYRSLLHRSLNLVGFIIMFIGFFQMKRAIEA